MADVGKYNWRMEAVVETECAPETDCSDSTACFMRADPSGREVYFDTQALVAALLVDEPQHNVVALKMKVVKHFPTHKRPFVRFEGGAVGTTGGILLGVSGKLLQQVADRKGATALLVVQDIVGAVKRPDACKQRRRPKGFEACKRLGAVKAATLSVRHGLRDAFLSETVWTAMERYAPAYVALFRPADLTSLVHEATVGVDGLVETHAKLLRPIPGKAPARLLLIRDWHATAYHTGLGWLASSIALLSGALGLDSPDDALALPVDYRRFVYEGQAAAIRGALVRALEEGAELVQEAAKDMAVSRSYLRALPENELPTLARVALLSALARYVAAAITRGMKLLDELGLTKGKLQQALAGLPVELAVYAPGAVEGTGARTTLVAAVKELQGLIAAGLLSLARGPDLTGAQYQAWRLQLARYARRIKHSCKEGASRAEEWTGGGGVGGLALGGF